MAPKNSMDLVVDISALVGALHLARKVADKQSVLPVLANVLLRVDGEQLVVSATDLQTAVTSTLTVKAISPGAITLPAKVLDEIVKSLPGEEVQLKGLDGVRVQLRSKRVSYSLAGLPASDFPKLPSHDKARYETIEAALLRDLIDKVSYSVSTDDTRPHLNGACVHAQDSTLVFASTDGHRLAEVQHRLDGELRINPHIIVPRKGLLEVRAAIEGVDGTVDFAVHNGYLLLRSGTLTLTVKLVDQQFPPYREVIPKNHDKRIIIDRAALRSAVKRATLVMNGREMAYGVRLKLSRGLLLVESDNPDLGQASEELDIEYLSAPLTIGFNGRFLIQMLDAIESQQVQLELAGELDPLLCRPVQGGEGEGAHGTGYTAVVMPMRV